MYIFHAPYVVCMYLLYVAADQAARIWGGGGLTDVAKYVRRIEEKEGKSIHTRSLAQPMVITVGVA